MFWHRGYDAFVSYSHRDEAAVKPMVEMLRLNERKVFWDHDLAAGDRWDEVIRASVKHSSVFVLFWCCDTHASRYVATEVEEAVRRKKKIVPVKLCPAALPPPLDGWQWIDLQARFRHECTAVDHTQALPLLPGVTAVMAPAPAPVSGPGFLSRGKWWMAAAAACLLLAMAPLLWVSLPRAGAPLERPAPAAGNRVRPQVTMQKQKKGTPPHTIGTPHPEQPAPSAPVATAPQRNYLVPLAGVLFAIGLFSGWLRSHLRRRRTLSLMLNYLRKPD